MAVWGRSSDTGDGECPFGGGEVESGGCGGGVREEQEAVDGDGDGD